MQSSWPTKKDCVYGDIIRVVDGDTADIRITRQAGSNNYYYNSVERIRLKDYNAPEIPSPAGYYSKRALQRAITGKHVRVKIHARDVYKRLIGDMQII